MTDIIVIYRNLGEIIDYLEKILNYIEDYEIPPIITGYFNMNFLDIENRKTSAFLRAKTCKCSYSYRRKLSGSDICHR